MRLGRIAVMRSETAWGMLLTTSAAYTLRMFRAVSLVNTPEMKKPSEEGFRGVAHSVRSQQLLRFQFEVGPGDPNRHARADEQKKGQHENAEGGLTHVIPPR